MRDLQSLARLWGLFVKPPPEQPREPIELVIFESYKDAQNTGFRNGRLPGYPHIRCWWGGAGMARLSGPPPFRVTIPYSMLRYKTEEGFLVDLLRARQRMFGDAAIWIEL